MYAHSYLLSARQILDLYDGSLPFAAWLKQYFREHKKFGSKDRKHVGHLCYCWFRSGFAFDHLAWEEQAAYSLFLCSSSPNPLLEAIDPALNARAGEALEEKMKGLEAGKHLVPEKIFIHHHQLSSLIGKESFINSFFIQPDLFLRIRPGKEKMVKEKLEAAGLSFRHIPPQSVALAGNIKTEDLPLADREVVIQDLSSQHTLDDLFGHLEGRTSFSAWDCCAASGGKSLLLHDRFPKVELTVSDIRKSILVNLEKRFGAAGIRQYRSMLFDASKAPLREMFDVVICDAPCSGSGTWGRTPEQLRFFKEEKIDHYANLQRSIALHACRSVKKDGFFTYITCSVFRQENEEVVKYIEENTGLKLLSMRYHEGHQQKADTLFTATFVS
jgi:16S rRNA (cytosine967-C5)-methyltransferase